MAKKNPRIAAIMAETVASSDDKLARIQAIMDEAEEEDDAEAEGNDAPPADDVKEDDDDKVDAKTARAIIALPEAKGREALANHLAFQSGMTVANAKATLALAPIAKASGLTPMQPDVGAGPVGSSVQSRGDGLMAAAQARASEITARTRR